jgi:branched-subunit amino acid ABC-type transport system permease component
VFIQPEYNTAVAFVILIVVLLFRPQGILSEIAETRELAV